VELGQRGSGAVRPLVVLYHAGGTPAVAKAAGPRAAIAWYAAQWKPGTGTGTAYTTFHPESPKLLDMLGGTAEEVGAEAFWPIVLVGFSAGCQALRTQLTAGQEPTAYVAIDGIHSGTVASEAQLAPWRGWMRKCGASIPSAQPDAIPRLPEQPLCIATCSQIQPSGYASVRLTLERITGWNLVPGGPDAPALYQSGGLTIASYPGGAPKDHIAQASAALPRWIGWTMAQLPTPPADLQRGTLPQWMRWATAVGLLVGGSGLGWWKRKDRAWNP